MQQQLNYSSVASAQSVLIDIAPHSAILPLKLIAGAVGLAALSTTGAQAVSVNPQHLNQTSAIFSATAREEDFRVSGALLAIKQSGGFTWQQIADLLGVSRRAVADWMKGQGIHSRNEIAIFQLRDRVEELAHLPQFKIRSALLGTKVSTTKLRSMLKDPAVFESENTPLTGGALESEDNTLDILE